MKQLELNSSSNFSFKRISLPLKMKSIVISVLAKIFEGYKFQKNTKIQKYNQFIKGCFMAPLQQIVSLGYPSN